MVFVHLNHLAKRGVDVKKMRIGKFDVTIEINSRLKFLVDNCDKNSELSCNDTPAIK